ncbi:hypothetical protein HI999_000762 [Salmonella enterica]|nr:hypothetical protein [Salmonella enterica]
MSEEIREITASEDISAFLLASGWKLQDCHFVTERLGKVDSEFVGSLSADRTIQMEVTLSICWLVQELRRHAMGPSGSVGAVEALRVLVDIALQKPNLVKPEASDEQA